MILLRWMTHTSQMSTQPVMDSHFEVILERVKTLTEKTGMTVWFEIPTTLTHKNILILINENNKICMIVLEYVNDAPMLKAYKLTKSAYDRMTECNYSSKSITDNTKQPIDTSRVVKWVTKVS